MERLKNQDGGYLLAFNANHIALVNCVLHDNSASEELKMIAEQLGIQNQIIYESIIEDKKTNNN